jgi:signal transduction histidine kinase
MRRLLVSAAVVFALAIGIATLIQAPDAEPLPPGGVSVIYIGVVLVWGFIGVGSFAWVRRPDNATGRLMVLVGIGVGVTAFQFFDTPALLALGIAMDTLSASILIHLLLAFPTGRVEGRWARRVVAAAYIAGASQLPGLLFTPCEEGCTIEENPWLVADVPALSAVFGLIQGLSLLVAIVGGVIVLLRRWRSSSRVQRRGLEPVLLLGAAILVIGLATVISNVATAPSRKVFQVLFFASFALVPWAFLLGLMRTRFFRTATVGRVIERLTLDPRGVRDALAAELGDPTLEVAYYLPDRGYVDGRGLPVADAPDQVVTEIEHEGRCVGALIHDPALCQEPELLREASAAAALAIENARLEVELRARLEALRASRTRLVEAGDAERRRLGRDLHDGAQQRLVALMIELQLARERFESDPAGARELVDSAFANAQEAVGELRDLAAGIHPAVLSQRGLEAALESLASRSKVPVELESELEERLPSPVETAAYFVVAEALTNVAKYAEATYARVEVRRENGAAVVDIRDDGVGGAAFGAGSGLTGLIDRVGALDGTLEVESPRGAGTLVRARFPLGP